MGKKSGGAPAAPDPRETARVQGAMNKEAVRESAKVNQIGTQGPQGKTYYTGEIGGPDRTLVTELNPTAQKAFDNQQNITLGLSQYGNKLADDIGGLGTFSLSGLPSAPWEADRSEMVGDLEKSTYDRAYNLMADDFERQDDQLNTYLETRGITAGSDAWKDANSQVAENRGRTLNDLALASVSAGRAEDSRLFNQGLTARNQGINEMITERTQPMNELSALLQGSPAISAPQSVAPGQYAVQPGDYQGAAALAYQGALNNANSNNAFMSNLLGLGGQIGSAFMLSDRRLKRDIKRVGTLRNGLGVYSFRYLFAPAVHVGVMAQEVVKVLPHAVKDVGGYLAVDYSEVLS